MSVGGVGATVLAGGLGLVIGAVVASPAGGAAVVSAGGGGGVGGVVVSGAGGGAGAVVVSGVAGGVVVVAGGVCWAMAAVPTSSDAAIRKVAFIGRISLHNEPFRSVSAVFPALPA